MNDEPRDQPIDGADSYRAILAAFTDTVIVVDPDGTIRWMNPAAEQFIGLGVNIVTGKHLSVLFAKEGDLQNEALTAIRRGRSLTYHDALFHTPRGAKIPVGVTVHPFGVEGGGEATGGVLILRDLTTLKTLERFMAVSDRMEELSTLAAGIAHEIKNPLGGIRGAAQLLESEIDPELAEYTTLITSETDRINRLVMELIELNQPGRFPRSPQNIYPILDDVIRLQTGPIEKKRIRVSKVYDPSLPSVVGNADKLRQIFLNLVKNGVEACREGGGVTIATKLAWKAPRATGKRRRGRYILVEITDEGGGLSEEDEAKIFTPFYSRKQGGSGLGLSMTMRLVQGHDGILEVTNRDDGLMGVMASVFLPFSTEAP